MRYAILLAYDGTDYGGWQIQKNSITIQEKLEEACRKAFNQKISVTASGRTDSGVHASGQVCHFDAETTIPANKIADVLNRFLPDDVAVLKSSEAPFNFDANRSAKRKTYCYRMYLSDRRNPLKDRYSLWVKPPLNIAKLRHITGSFVGKHDFKAYCKSGSQVKTTVREIYSAEVKIVPQRLFTDIEFYVTGGGFLYNMVRTMAGTVLNFAQGAITEEEVISSLENCDRESVGRTLPSRGLTLEEVDYGLDLFL